MEEQILDSPLRRTNEQIRTRLIKGLEVLLFVAFILLIMGIASAFAWQSESQEEFRSLIISSVFFLCLPAYAFWFRKKSIAFDADTSLQTFEFSIYASITRIVSIILGVIFLMMAVAMPYLVISNPPMAMIRPMYGLAIFYFFFSGSLSALFLSYPILTKRRVNAILKV